MTAFRIMLGIIWLTLTTYTGIVTAHHGLNLMPIFFGDIAKMAWPGQFNLDFLFMLSLSGLWVAWRHHFSVAGIVLGVLAFNLGAFFLSAYLLITGLRVKGDMKALLLGETRAAG